MVPALRGLEMNSALVKFFNVSIANLLVGGGLGAVAAWCMTTGLERPYQMAVVEGTSALGAGMGLLLGWVAYYGIFKQGVKYETFCAVVAVTAVATDVTAYVLHRATDTGGWLALFVAVPVFLIRSEEHTSELQSRGHLVCRLL